MRPPLDPALESWLRALPKAEMHLHFEGAFRWGTIRELHPSGPSLPATPPWLARSRPFPDFDDFAQALRDYVLPVTGSPQWIERHAFEVTEDLARQAVRYAEIIVSHDFHTRRGLDHPAVWAAIVAGRDRAMACYPIETTRRWCARWRRKASSSTYVRRAMCCSDARRATGSIRSGRCSSAACDAR